MATCGGRVWFWERLRLVLQADSILKSNYLFCRTDIPTKLYPYSRKPNSDQFWLLPFLMVLTIRKPDIHFLFEIMTCSFTSNIAKMINEQSCISVIVSEKKKTRQRQWQDMA